MNEDPPVPLIRKREKEKLGVAQDRRRGKKSSLCGLYHMREKRAADDSTLF